MHAATITPLRVWSPRRLRGAARPPRRQPAPSTLLVGTSVAQSKSACFTHGDCSPPLSERSTDVGFASSPEESQDFHSTPCQVAPDGTLRPCLAITDGSRNRRQASPVCAERRSTSLPPPGLPGADHPQWLASAASLESCLRLLQDTAMEEASMEDAEVEGNVEEEEEMRPEESTESTEGSYAASDSSGHCHAFCNRFPVPREERSTVAPPAQVAVSHGHRARSWSETRVRRRPPGGHHAAAAAAAARQQLAPRQREFLAAAGVAREQQRGPQANLDFPRVWRHSRFMMPDTPLYQHVTTRIPQACSRSPSPSRSQIRPQESRSRSPSRRACAEYDSPPRRPQAWTSSPTSTPMPIWTHVYVTPRWPQRHASTPATIRASSQHPKSPELSRARDFNKNSTVQRRAVTSEPEISSPSHAPEGRRSTTPRALRTRTPIMELSGAIKSARANVCSTSDFNELSPSPAWTPSLRDGRVKTVRAPDCHAQGADLPQVAPKGNKVASASRLPQRIWFPHDHSQQQHSGTRAASAREPLRPKMQTQYSDFGRKTNKDAATQTLQCSATAFPATVAKAHDGANRVATKHRSPCPSQARLSEGGRPRGELRRVQTVDLEKSQRTTKDAPHQTLQYGTPGLEPSARTHEGPKETDARAPLRRSNPSRPCPGNSTPAPRIFQRCEPTLEPRRVAEVSRSTVPRLLQAEQDRRRVWKCRGLSDRGAERVAVPAGEKQLAAAQAPLLVRRTRARNAKLGGG